MIRKLLGKIRLFLREHQDPRYRNAPRILPKRAWRGIGGPLIAEQLALFNVKDMGLDPAVVSQQPINRSLLATARRAQRTAAQMLSGKK